MRDDRRTHADELCTLLDGLYLGIKGKLNDLDARDWNAGAVLADCIAHGIQEASIRRKHWLEDEAAKGGAGEALAREALDAVDGAGLERPARLVDAVNLLDGHLKHYGAGDHQDPEKHAGLMQIGRWVVDLWPNG